MLNLPDAVPTLVDGELLLRPWSRDDADAVFEACQDPAIQEYTTVPVPYTREDAAAFLDYRVTAKPSEDMSWAMVWEGRLAGSVSLHHVTVFDHIVELGYWVTAPARGRGFASRSAKLVSDFGFACGFRRISALTLPENIGSQRTLLAAGFELEGVQRAAMTRRDGTQTDSVVFAKFPPVVIDDGEPE